MLIHEQHPGFGPAPTSAQGGRPLRTAIGDAARRFWHATQPPARTGAGVGAALASRLMRAVLWLNLQAAAVLGIVALYTGGKVRSVLAWARFAVPFAILATVMVLLKAVWRLLLIPFHHVALSIVAAAAVVEALLIGRIFVQLAYDPEVTGLAGTVLMLTDPLVEPFRDLEGTAILHDTGVVEFATLTAMEAYLVATIAFVIALLFWSEFLHMYRRIATYFYERSERRKQVRDASEPQLQSEPVAITPVAEISPAAADLGAAS
jgi:hypothetical protein